MQLRTGKQPFERAAIEAMLSHQRIDQTGERRILSDRHRLRRQRERTEKYYCT
ncbi:MAG TPA: hypothetical protein VI565_08915 [Burkholderiales bacterium]|nr:hypothetical protein [Burkholderiales bacterium]